AGPPAVFVADSAALAAPPVRASTPTPDALWPFTPVPAATWIPTTPNPAGFALSFSPRTAAQPEPGAPEPMTPQAPVAVPPPRMPVDPIPLIPGPVPVLVVLRTKLPALFPRASIAAAAALVSWLTTCNSDPASVPVKAVASFARFVCPSNSDPRCV